jgi:hypothetical protein
VADPHGLLVVRSRWLPPDTTRWRRVAIVDLRKLGIDI